MAVPRPVLFALLGLALLVAAFLATRSGQGESVTPPPKTEAAPGLNASDPSKAAAGAKGSHDAAGTGTPPKPATPAAQKPKPKPAIPADVRKAAEALDAKKVVVLLFTKPGAADDTQTRLSARAVRGMKGVVFVQAGIERLAAFRPMLDSSAGSLGISQIPATVIVRPGGKAVLLQGFVDPGTLRQNVADALR
jgi:hypothetical protein